MKIYLDTNVFNRPFDDQTQPRIILETQALRTILKLIEMGNIELMSSSVLAYENSRNTSPVRQKWVHQCLALATTSQPLQNTIIQRAKALEQTGLKTIDALHVATAEAAQCEVFLTCDDRLLRRYSGPLRAMNPVTLVLELTEVSE
ncbi:type II toxin-antitoxin system VapC family toxin [Spirulina major]|uniref:type II toxin-antitoxin system VapC family toxin n=1 Tax=Spirulina major TaxID=270636 RepID=UPI0009330C05|nr:PIN domain-containing protein [Spirulina major]